MELASGDGAFGKLQACSVLYSGQQAPDFHWFVGRFRVQEREWAV